jgi:large subunit ribosomal protein L1
LNHEGEIMAKHGKKYLQALEKVNRDENYAPRDAISLAKEIAYTQFDGTVEIHMRLGVDPRHADQQVRDVVVLPHGLGKTVRVLVFAQGEGAALAREAGADIVADDDETLAKIQGGWTEFDAESQGRNCCPRRRYRPRCAGIQSRPRGIPYR